MFSRMTFFFPVFKCSQTSQVREMFWEMGGGGGGAFLLLLFFLEGGCQLLKRE